MPPKVVSSYARYLAQLPAQLKCVEMKRDVTRERRKQLLRQALRLRGWTVARQSQQIYDGSERHVRHLCGNDWCGNWGHVIIGTVRANGLDKQFHNVHGTPVRVDGAPLLRRNPDCLPRLAPDGWTLGVTARFTAALPLLPEEYELRCNERCRCIVCVTLRPYTRTIIDGRWTLPAVESIQKSYVQRVGGWGRLVNMARSAA